MKKTHDNYMTRMKAFMELAIAEQYPRVIRELAVILMHLVNANFWQPVTYSDFELSRLSRIPEGSLTYARQFLIDNGFMTVSRKKNKCCYTLLNCAKNDLGNSYATLRQNLGENGEEWRDDAVSQSQNASSIHQYVNTNHDDNCAAVAQSTASVVGNGTKKDYDSWLEELPEKQRRTLQALTDKMTPKQYKDVKQKYAKYAYNKNCPYAYMLTIIRQIANGSPDAAQGQAVDETLAAKHAQSDARILEEARKIAAANGLQDPLTRLGNQTLTIPAATNDDTLSLAAACDLPDSINAQAVIEYAPATSLKPDSNGLVYSSAQQRAAQDSKRVYTVAEAAKLGKDLPVGAVITTQPSKEEIADGYRKFADAKYEAQCNAPDDADETISAEIVSKEMTAAQRVQQYQRACAVAEKYGLPVPEPVECSLSAEDVAINLDESISVETDETISVATVEIIDADETISADEEEEVGDAIREVVGKLICTRIIESIDDGRDCTIREALEDMCDEDDETPCADLGGFKSTDESEFTKVSALVCKNTDETISEDDDSAQIDADKSKAMALCATFGMNPNNVDGLAKALRERREAAQAKPATKNESIDLGIDENLINGYVQAAQGVTLPDEPTYDELKAMKYAEACKAVLDYSRTIHELLNLPVQTTEYKEIDTGRIHDSNLRIAIQMQQSDLYDKHKAEAIFVDNVEKAVFHALGRKTWGELLDLRKKPRSEAYKVQEDDAGKRAKRLAELKERAAYRAKNVFVYRHNREQNRRLIIDKDTAALYWSEGIIQKYTASEAWDNLDRKGWDRLFTLDFVAPLKGDV